MLTFTQAELDRIAFASGDERVVACIHEHLRVSQGAHVAAFDDAALDALIGVGMARARGHGLARAQCLGAFVSLMVRAGPCFDREPLLAARLADTAVPEGDRLARLTAPDTQAAWDAAQANYRPGDWRAAVRALHTTAEAGQ